MDNTKTPWFLLMLSLFVALCLSAIPVSGWLASIWPDWLLLCVLAFCLLRQPVLGLISAWCLGLALDLLLAMPLGLHSIAMTAVVFLALKFQHQLVMFSRFQQCVVILIVSLIYSSVLIWVMSLLGEPGFGFSHWLAVISNTLLWPWISSVISGYNKAYQSYIQ